MMAASPRSSAAVRELPADIERLYNGGLYRQAAESLNAAIQREPREASLHYWLGRCFYELRDYNRAISSLERAIAIEADHSEYHDWLGKAYGRKAEEASRFSAFSSISLAHKTRREFEAAVRLDREQPGSATRPDPLSPERTRDQSAEAKEPRSSAYMRSPRWIPLKERWRRPSSSLRARNSMRPIRSIARFWI